MGKNRYIDGFQCLCSVDNDLVSPLLVGSGVAIAKGDCCTISSGYVALATTMADLNDIYVSIGENTAAEASADGVVEGTFIYPFNYYRFMVSVGANAVLAQATNVGNIYNLDGSEDEITIAAAFTKDCGFLIEAIDISTAALAINTYGYAIGRFVKFAETT